ncbi:hypothetical protein AM629_04095 [Photorhabdus heterorhabditis]|uniref:Uncharacterized protein n=1 Tax=Photorhabdus heterorhabditis TaxID=880156 RepID=A0ABR5KH78_9GAMM|nr:hypothetical protein AM629_04095 [Photorhabdus heterorhabditis]
MKGYPCIMKPFADFFIKIKWIEVTYSNISELSVNRIVNSMVVMKEEEKLKTKSVLMNAQKSLIKNHEWVIRKVIQ